MSKIGFSKSDNKRAVMALAIVAMFLAAMGMGVTNVEASSPIKVEVDQTTFDIMKGDLIRAKFVFTNGDTKYQKQDFYLSANWQDGVEWSLRFQDSDENDISNNLVEGLAKNADKTVYVVITCGSNCNAGDETTVVIMTQSDPKWYGGPGISGGTTGLGGCGSADCLTDTTAASASGNTTSTTLTLRARAGESHTVVCEDTHDGGSIDVYQGTRYNWAYTLTNAGWNTDSYVFTSTVTSTSGADVSEWTVLAGLENGKELTGTSSTGVSEVEANVQITPSFTARPGTYTIELIASSNNGGAPDNCEFDVIVPAPDLEIKETDVDFSHTSAWINIRGDSQKVTIYATVRNNGGNIDSTGASTNEVMVKFYADSAPVGTSQTVSLKHGEEETISVSWNPGRASTSEEPGIIISVKVDPTSDIEESDETNNEGNQYFKVVRTKSSTPSFYMGIFALIGSVAVAVMLSSYYRNKDSEE